MHQFFNSRHYWGRVLGGSLGYLILGPVGALFGILIGNMFDRGLSEHISKPYWQYHAEKIRMVQQTFFKATFLIMGHIAKADGRITEEQINTVKYLMQGLRLGRQEQKLAQNHFNEGKENDFDIWPILSSLRDATKNNPELLKLFFDLQFQAALSGGLSAKKKHILNTILTYMGFAPLSEQHRFYEEFKDHFSQHQYQRSSSHSSHRTSQSDISFAYRILNIPETANKQEVKRAYRKLMSNNHPDKMVAKGLPESMIKQANEKTQQIRKAYEQICTRKGW